eukprot:11285771-Alexandrium_andersonii.AAC.1
MPAQPGWSSGTNAKTRNCRPRPTSNLQCATDLIRRMATCPPNKPAALCWPSSNPWPAAGRGARTGR